MTNLTSIGEKYAEPATEEQLRILQLQMALKSVILNLGDAMNHLVGPREHQRPTVAACQISNALHIARRNLGDLA